MVWDAEPAYPYRGSRQGRLDLVADRDDSRNLVGRLFLGGCLAPACHLVDSPTLVDHLSLDGCPDLVDLHFPDDSLPQGDHRYWDDLQFRGDSRPNRVTMGDLILVESLAMLSVDHQGENQDGWAMWLVDLPSLVDPYLDAYLAMLKDAGLAKMVSIRHWDDLAAMVWSMGC